MVSYRQWIYRITVALNMIAQGFELLYGLTIYPMLKKIVTVDYETRYTIFKSAALPILLFDIALIILTDRESKIRINTLIVCTVSSLLPTLALILFYRVTFSTLVCNIYSILSVFLCSITLAMLLCDVFSFVYESRAASLTLAALLVPISIVSIWLTLTMPLAMVLFITYGAPVFALILTLGFVLANSKKLILTAMLVIPLIISTEYFLPIITAWVFTAAVVLLTVLYIIKLITEIKNNSKLNIT